MSKLVFASRLALAALLMGTLQSACGGQSFTSGGEPNGGSGNEGGTGSNTAGTHSTAGKGHAGSSSAGTSSGGTASGGTASGGEAGNAAAGSGGTPDAACSGPYEAGNIGCDAYIPNWTHDEKTGLCMPIVYGGCGATKNNYGSLAACQKACPGGNPNYDACAAPSDCMLASPGCCGVCDGPGVTTHDFIAYNRQNAGKVMTCLGDVACGPCPPPMGDSTLKYFVPNCVQSQCIVDDLRTSELTACKTDMDCKLRMGKGCCPSCNPGDLLAVRSDGSFEKAMCGGLLPPCAACMIPPNPDAIAVCGARGHCEVAYLTAGSTP